MDAGSPNVLFFVTEDWYFRSHRAALADQLAAQGHQITVGTRLNESRDADGPGNLVEYIPVPFRRSLKHPLLDVLCCILIAWTIFRRKPDIVHLVALKPILTSIIAVYLFPNTPFVHAFAGMGYLFSSSDRRAKAVQKLAIRVLEIIMRRPNAWVLVQNEDDRQLLLEQRWMAEERIALIPGSGIDTAQFTPSPRESPSRDTPLRVVLPARMIRDKGVEDFVEAALIVSREKPDVEFALVGGLDPDNPASIPESTIRQWIADAGVTWLGHRPDMVNVYRDSDVVCLPSYREGLPKVLLEAAACGKPLVATDVPGCRDVCVHESTGLLVRARDPEALAAALLRMLSDHGLRERCGAAARALVLEHHALPVISRRTASFYRHVLTRRGPS